jgi:parallel beta-helix repeat protein
VILIIRGKKMRFLTSKKVIVVIITVSLFISVLLRAAIHPVKSIPKKIIVPDDYPTIQKAIDAASDGDSIYVHSGTYYESITVNKPLTLIGENRENTIIDGGGIGTVIKVIASKVVIKRFTVQNSNRTAGTSYAGIEVSGTLCNITGNHITKNRIGILVKSQKTRITQNILTNNGHGISLYSSSKVTVKSNDFAANTYGISLAARSTNNLILNNSITKCSAGGHAIYLLDSFNNTILGNHLINNPHGIWLSKSYSNFIIENIIANNKILGIELASSSDNKIYHNSFINNTKHTVIDNKSTNTWDNGYPSGGNHWDDYTYVDEKNGPNQDQPGSDGIWDKPYTINERNSDNYPLVNPYGDISVLMPKKPVQAIPPWISVAAIVFVIAIIIMLLWKFKRSKSAKRKRMRRLYTRQWGSKITFSDFLCVYIPLWVIFLKRECIF